MLRIHAINSYTIPESIYDSLLLQFSTSLLSAMKLYLQTPIDQRHRYLITRIYRSLDSFPYPSATSQLTEWINQFPREPLNQAVDLSICVLFLLQASTCQDDR